MVSGHFGLFQTDGGGHVGELKVKKADVSVNLIKYLVKRWNVYILFEKLFYVLLCNVICYKHDMIPFNTFFL